MLAGLGAASLLGACSTIIGLGDYDIVPSLGAAGSPAGNEGGEPSSGGTHQGGKGQGGSVSGGGTAAGADTGGDAGSPGGGTASGGGSAGSSAAGEGGGSGQGGEGGSPDTPGCQSSRDCDDSIDCTTDACNARGVCTHTPKDTACDAGNCEVCTLGIGCVAGPKKNYELLVDPAFDLGSTDWSQQSDTFNDQNIFSDPKAQSGTMIAKFGPAAADAKAQEYADLLQYVTIPADTVAITLTGYYQLKPGVKKPADDYVAVGFWDPASSSIMPAEQFHSFAGSGGAKSAWTAFSYALTAAEVKGLAGKEYTFDLVANVWDSEYRFDSLKLTGSSCK